MQVSVIIPVYNAASFLDRSIKSALDKKQTGEVLLIDDRSTDESLEICRKWENLDRRVRVFINQGTKGAGAARNIGLKNAQCEFIAFLDADDYYLEGRFDDTETLFLNDENLAGVGESIEVTSTNSTFIYKYGFKKDYHHININEFLTMPSFHIIGFTIKQSAVLKIGYFNENLKQTQDTDYLARAISECKIISGKYNTSVAHYYLHGTNSIYNLTERNKYRTIFYAQYAKKAIFKFHDIKLFLKMFKYYRIYSFQLAFKNTEKKLKLLKLVYLPLQLVKLLLNRF